MKNISPSRRFFVKSSVFGVLAISTTSMACANPITAPIATTYAGEKDADLDKGLFYRYPALDDDSVSAVVGAAHTNLEKVKNLVNNRPELANAAWDWGFGDWESAIGAAAHMGRKDIAEFLMSHGARPDHFTFAMLGELDALKAMIAAQPGLQRIPGPHGIPLLQHAKHRLWHKDISAEETKKVNAMIAYLESLGDADQTAKNMDISDAAKEMYVGEYRYGEKTEEVFEIKINRRKMLSIGKKGDFGRSMNRIGDDLFSPGGAPSVQISFVIKDGQAISLTIHEPDPLVIAKRV